MRRSAAGFTLIEILIAILIAAIGVIGIAGLQAFTLKSTHGSNLRSIATRQAYELADSMRANQAAVDAGLYNNQQGTQVDTCYSTGCTTTQMAQMDVFLWNQNNAALLPSGRGFICTDGTPNDGVPTAPACDNQPNAPYVIKIWWDEREGDGQLQRFVFTFRP